MVIDQPLPFRGETGILPHVEITKRFPFLNPLQVIVGIGVFCAAFVIEILPDIFRIAEVDELVAHSRPHKIHGVGEIARVDSVECDVELKSGVFHRAHIHVCLVEQIRRYRHLIVAQQILLAAVEIVERTIEAVVEHREVQAHVPVLTFLPMQVRIDVFRRAPYLEIFPIIVIIAEACHSVERQVAAKILITRHTVVGADFKIVYPLRPLHELLFRNAPPGRNRREVTPLVIGTEFRRTLMAQRRRQKIFTVEIIAHAAEKRNKFGIVLIAAHKHFTLLFGKIS